ncbi:MAG: DUF1405 domain-containing protein, partial [Candidatus Aenigmarchaeota archaeon]|nr:DUF1405 domain-containing protein [Candidatus Aenigmarchaeota archaeon]
FVEALAFIGMIKVGFWTAFIILVYNWYFLQPAYLYWYGSLFFLHLGMCAEGFAMKERLNITRVHALVASAFYVINDIADYVFNLVPRRDIILGSHEFPIVAGESFLVTLALSHFLLKRART